jgi:hypothetical protein
VCPGILKVCNDVRRAYLFAAIAIAHGPATKSVARQRPSKQAGWPGSLDARHYRHAGLELFIAFFWQKGWQGGEVLLGTAVAVAVHRSGPLAFVAE